MSDAREQFSQRAAIAIAALLSLAGALASYFAAGATLGCLFGGIVFATLIAPPFVVLRLDRCWMLLIAAAVATPAAGVWCFVLPSLGAVLILLSYVGAICAIARTLTLVRIPPTLAQAVTIVLALAWLSWPMWLRIGNDRIIDKLVLMHPLMNLNSLMIPQGVWTQQHIMYQLTSLGQDVPYQLPRNVWVCVVAQMFVGLLALMPAGHGLETRATGESSGASKVR